MIRNSIRLLSNKCAYVTCGRQFTAGKILYSKSTQSKKTTSKLNESSSSVPNLKQVVGLSNAVISEIRGPVGPNASKEGEYKNTEYFCYHKSSFFDAELEMAKYRCPQPSVKD